MASTATAVLKLEKQGNEDNPGTWGERLNTLFDMVDAAITGATAIATTGGTTTLDNDDYTLDAAKYITLDVSGALASNAIIVVPSANKLYFVVNGTTEAYSLTVKTSAGSGVAIPQGAACFVRASATDDDVYFASSPIVESTGVDTDLTTHLNDTAAAHAASAISNAPAGDIVATTVQAAIDELDTEKVSLADLASNANSLGASLVGIEDAAGNFTATDLEAALAEIFTDFASNANALGASLVGIEDSGGLIAATDVEAALAEIAADVAALDQAVILKGTWDASVGTFPGAGAAQAGWSYIVSVGGTVDSEVFVANDRIVAILDNASTTTYAANWHKLDYTDQVLSVAGKTGAVTLAVADLSDASANGQSLIAAANYAAMRALLDLEAGTDFYSIAAADAAFQPLDSDLTAIAALTTTTYGRALLESVDAATLFGAIKQAASDSATGVVELAIASELNTGTDTGRAVTPDALAGSNYGTAVVEIQCFRNDEDVATGDDAANGYFRIPAELNGFDLVGVAAHVGTAGTTGTTDIQVHNVTQAADMLSTKLTIDTGETDSSTAAAAAVIDTANDDVATGDKIRIDVDAISTTAPIGLVVTLEFRLP